MTRASRQPCFQRIELDIGRDLFRLGNVIRAGWDDHFYTVVGTRQGGRFVDVLPFRESDHGWPWHTPLSRARHDHLSAWLAEMRERQAVEA